MRALVIELLPHTTEAEARELAAEVQAAFGFHYAPRYSAHVQVDDLLDAAEALGIDLEPTA